MNQEFYHVTVKPTITAQYQHLGAFNSGVNDILFDWTEIKMPKGAGRLISTAVVVRGNKSVAQRYPMQLYFSKSDDFSLGTINSAPDMDPNNDLLGQLYIRNSHYGIGLDSMDVAHAFAAKVCIEPVANLSATGGNSKHRNDQAKHLYVAAVATHGDFDWSDTVPRVDETDFGPTDGRQYVITVDAGDPRLHFAPGDVIHTHQNLAVGTIKSVDSITQITLTNSSVDSDQQDITNSDYLYNIHPIHLIFTFAYNS